MAGQDEHLVNAFKLASTGDIDGAIQLYRDALIDRPQDDESAAFLGQLLMLKGDYHRGLTLHERRP
ncbi:MAG: hypothetical protein HY055_13230, partial [Magnetospirillum sp.]|nr:hypothetical protein [Magnetospirillum sp.]